jgi:phospholipid transport system substrate-binding protein
MLISISHPARRTIRSGAQPTGGQRLPRSPRLARWIGAVLLATCSSLTLAQEIAPDTLVRDVTTQALAIMREAQNVQAGDPKKVAELVQARILPYFDFERMTQIAVAANWRQATPEQQKALTSEFKALLVHTYSNALSLYRDQSIDVKPTRMKSGDTEVTVKAELRGPRSQALKMDYDLEKTPTGWKVMDVRVDGMSLILNYRSDFAARVRDSGIDGLIHALAAKNGGGKPDRS